MNPSHGMVVSAHPLASEAGAAILRRGGNAFDAAVSTSLMLGVVEPAFSGIGGGGFAVLHKSSGENSAIDYREVAPLESSSSMFLDGTDRNRVGPLAVATPGLLAGHARILEEFGTMKFKDLARPAVEAAKSAISVKSLSHTLLHNRSGVADKIRRFRTSARVFLGKSTFPMLAKTLTGLADGRPEEFYHGSIPRRMARHLRSLGGILSEEDFERYAPRGRSLVKGMYQGYDLVSMPPPSAGGTLLIHGLGLLEEAGGGNSFALGEAERLGITAAILESILGEKWRFGDPEYTDVPVAKLLSRGTLTSRAGEIRSGGATPRGPSKDLGSTTHLCVLDRRGNAAALTETIECYYGSGITVPGLGIVLNDEMHDFDIVPGRPNSVEPLKRPASSMSPTIVLKDGSPFLILGGSGSERIISSVFQVVANVVEGGMRLPASLAAPRIHPSGGDLMLEGGFSSATVEDLRRSGRRLSLRRKGDMYFGGVQAIMVDPGSGRVAGAADPRRLGAAAVG